MGHRDMKIAPVGEQDREAGEEGSDGLEDSGHDGETSHDDFHPFDGESSNRDPLTSASQLRQAVRMPRQKSNRRILIVDDERAIADTLALIFRTQHYETRTAYSAEQAIEILAEWRPDLTVLDVILPGMNGIDLAVVIKANYPACHVILFSGHANTGRLLEEAGRKGHQFEVLAKPVHPSVMLERASALLGSSEETLYD